MLKLIRSLAICLALLMSEAYAELEVHFLDVGQGDASLVLCDGEAMLIDGGPATASQFLYSYIRQKVDELDVIVATHPHDDHIGGLPAALNAVPVGVIYSPVTEWNTISWDNVAKYAESQGTPIVVPSEGDTFTLGGALVTILHCWPDAWYENDMSIALRVDYEENSFLFTGDAEEMSEEMMLSDKVNVCADVLKVAHHGSMWSSTPDFITKVSPTWAVISCGKGNAYGHPHHEVLHTLEKAMVLRTDQIGTIIFHGNGTTLSLEKGITLEVTTTYIGNRKSLKFHHPGCEAVADMAEANKVPISTREDAVKMGFKPCGRCKP